MINEKQDFNSRIPFSTKDAEAMAERTSRKKTQDLLDLENPERFIVTKPEPIEIALGYSISVKYDKNGKPLIYVKKYGDVDTQGLRRQIERNYPGASIQGLEKARLIEVPDLQKKTLRGSHSKRSKKHKKDC